MKIKRIRVVNTKLWKIKPVAGEIFRIGGDAYICYFTFWTYAIIQFDHTMEWEW